MVDDSVKKTLHVTCKLFITHNTNRQLDLSLFPLEIGRRYQVVKPVLAEYQFVITIVIQDPTLSIFFLDPTLSYTTRKSQFRLGPNNFQNFSALKHFLKYICYTPIIGIMHDNCCILLLRV